MEINLTNSTFDGEVIKSDMPVLVDFWHHGADLAEWLQRLLRRLQMSIQAR